MENLIGEICKYVHHLPKGTIHTNNEYMSFVHTFVNFVLCVHLWPLLCPVIFVLCPLTTLVTFVLLRTYFFSSHFVLPSLESFVLTLVLCRLSALLCVLCPRCLRLWSQFCLGPLSSVLTCVLPLLCPVLTCFLYRCPRWLPLSSVLKCPSSIVSCPDLCPLTSVLASYLFPLSFLSCVLSCFPLSFLSCVLSWLMSSTVCPRWLPLSSVITCVLPLLCPVLTCDLFPLSLLGLIEPFAIDRTTFTFHLGKIFPHESCESNKSYLIYLPLWIYKSLQQHFFVALT